MILTTLQQLTRYQPQCPNFADAIAWAEQANPASLAFGKHDIDGERLFVIHESIELSPFGPDSVWEAHNRYIDIQYILEGTERMAYAPRTESLPVKTPYDFATDKVFYDAAQLQGTMIDVPAGHTAVLFPEDTHAPGLALDDPAASRAVKKLVLKVRVD